MEQAELDYLRAVQMEGQENKLKNSQLAHAAANSLFLGNQNQNLIEWQLELDNILERVDHLLRGHVLEFDGRGNVIWNKPKDKRLIVFTEYGVQELLRHLSMYLNRNTILSNYDEPTINWKVLDFGNRLIDLIFRKYEDMFYVPEGEDFDKIFFDYVVNTQSDMDILSSNPDKLRDKILELKREIILEKIKLYETIVGELVDIVHSAYLRAYNGGERESLRTARVVTQNEPLGQVNQMQQQQSKGSWYNPFSWGR